LNAHGWSALDLNPHAVWTADTDGRVDYLSERWLEWTGKLGLGQAWADSVHPDDLPKLAESWRCAVVSGEPADIEHRLCMRSGHYRWMRSRALAQRNSAGVLVSWYGATEDIDDRKRAEQALQSTEVALRALKLSLSLQVKHRTDELTELNRHLQSTREEERHRLAGALHDDLGALYTAAKFDVARLKSALAPLSPEVAARFCHFSDMLDKSIDSKRHMIEDLRPSALSSLGLVQALRILISDFTRSHGIKVQVELEELPLKPAVKLTVYRLVQEALENVAAYARAGKVWVRLTCEGDAKVQISVTDDGVGFDATSERIAMLGLLGMHYRVEADGGCFVVKSSHQCGTTLSACFPVLFIHASASTGVSDF
jgi:PAS domain S-box-containing protein